MAMAANAAAELRDEARSAHIQRILLPYRHLFVDNASTFFGSVEHYVGMLSAVLGDWTGADEAFAAALAAHEALHSPPLLARTQVEYARALHTELRNAGVRATIDATSDPIKAKIANAETMKVHTMLVLGKRDLEGNNVSVRVHGKGNLGAKPRAEVVADLLLSIKERRS